LKNHHENSQGLTYCQTLTKNISKIKNLPS